MTIPFSLAVDVCNLSSATVFVGVVVVAHCHTATASAVVDLGDALVWLRYLLSLRYLHRHLPSCSHLIAISVNPNPHGRRPTNPFTASSSSLHKNLDECRNVERQRDSFASHQEGESSGGSRKLKLNFPTHPFPTSRRHTLSGSYNYTALEKGLRVLRW